MARLVTLEDAKKAADELRKAGKKRTNVKIACWAAALSVQQGLSANGRMLRALVDGGYVQKPLPTDYETCKRIFESGDFKKDGTPKYLGMFGPSHHRALLRVEYLHNRGMLDWMSKVEKSRQGQLEQRHEAHKLLSGYSFAWKALSMIPLVISPNTCEVVPVDRHHLARLGLSPLYGESAPSSERSYCAIETMIYSERAEAECTSVPLGVWAWFKWEEYRVAVGASKASEGAESHKLLSPRMY
jgi:hypothetical protein